MATIVQTSQDDWIIELERDKTLSRPLSLLDERQADQEKRLRNAAEKWLGGITTLSALFALSGVVTAKDALSGLATAWRLAIAFSFTCSIAAAVGSIVLGYTATYGWPRMKRVLTADQVRSWGDEQRQAGERSASQLRWAVILALLAVGLLAALAFALWFVPRTPAPPTIVIVRSASAASKM